MVMPAAAQEEKVDGNTATPAIGAATPRVFRLAGAIVGTVIITAGGCTQGFSNQCPSGHTCDCFTAMGAKFSSSKIGKGSANFFATMDHTADFGALGKDCAPLFGEIDVIAANDSPSFDVIGGGCGTSRNGVVSNGAMGMSASNLFVANGYAVYRASMSFTTLNSGRLTVSFLGEAQ
jgi:hypothetical protein